MFPVAAVHFRIEDRARWTEEAVLAIVGTKMPNPTTGLDIGEQTRHKLALPVGALKVGPGD